MYRSTYSTINKDDLCSQQKKNRDLCIVNNKVIEHNIAL
jgi:hypothetical protein